MIFENIKSITIPEGEVKRILYGSVVLWQKLISKIVNFIDTLTIQDGAKRNIELLTQYGKCEQASTPSPSVPVDIKCNNGTIKAKHESGLPIEYQKVEYIESSGTQYINTGYIPDGNEIIELTFDFVNLPIQTNWIILFGEREQATATSQANYWLGINYAGALYSRFGTVNVSSQPTLTSGTTYNIKVDVPNRTLYVNNDSYTFTNSVISDITKSIFLGNINAPVGATLNLGGTANYRSMKITKNDNILHNFIPCYRKSDNEAGLYNIVTNTFFANAGTGSFAVGSDVADSVEIYADGTPEVLTVVSETTQTASVENLFGVGDYKDEQSIISGVVARACGIKVLDGTEDWKWDGAMHHLVVSNMVQPVYNRTVKMISTHYPIASNGEAFSNVAINTMYCLTGGRIGLKNDTMDSTQFKDFLAQQYANGTPVIVIYPLATETTEEVTPQPLYFVEDTNTISVSAEVSDIDFEIKYKAKVI